MQLILAILIFTLLSYVALGEQGTMSSDQTTASEAEASLSGTSDQGIDLREEEVQMEEGNYDAEAKDEQIRIESDQEILDQYQEEINDQQ